MPESRFNADYAGSRTMVQLLLFEGQRSGASRAREMMERAPRSSLMIAKPFQVVFQSLCQPSVEVRLRQARSQIPHQ